MPHCPAEERAPVENERFSYVTPWGQTVRTLAFAWLAAYALYRKASQPAHPVLVQGALPLDERQIIVFYVTLCVAALAMSVGALWLALAQRFPEPRCVRLMADGVLLPSRQERAGSFFVAYAALTDMTLVSGKKEQMAVLRHGRMNYRLSAKYFHSVQDFERFAMELDLRVRLVGNAGFV